jgi:hypothetical protein
VLPRSSALCFGICCCESAPRAQELELARTRRDKLERLLQAPRSSA